MISKRPPPVAQTCGFDSLCTNWVHGEDGWRCKWEDGLPIGEAWPIACRWAAVKIGPRREDLRDLEPWTGRKRKEGKGQ